MTTSLIEVCASGDGSRHTAAMLDAEAGPLTHAIRRALPFIARRAVGLTPGPFVLATESALIAGLTRPVFSLPLTCATGARGLLAVDGPALALMLDGVLGGDGSAVPELKPSGLTPPQAALATRLGDSVARALSERVNQRFGLALRPAPGQQGIENSVLLATTIALETAGGGHMVLALPRVLPSPRGEDSFRKDDAAIASVLADVPIELTVDLGRIQVSLARLASLKVGDTLLSDISTSSMVVVRAGHEALVEGRPTNLGGQFAVRIERRHTT